jgi:hypothetical protein
MTVSQWDAAAISLYRRFCACDVTPAETAVELPPIWRFRSDRDPPHGPVAWQAVVEHAGYFCWGPEGGGPVGARGGATDCSGGRSLSGGRACPASTVWLQASTASKAARP